MNEAEPMIEKWSGYIDNVADDFFEATLWSLGEDEGDNRQAVIPKAMVEESDKSFIRRGADFECWTIIPPPKGQPMILEITFIWPYFPIRKATANQ